MPNKINYIWLKKILWLIILVIIVFSNTFLKANAENNECFSYSNKEDFPLYKERVRCICEKYKPDRELKVIPDKYEKINSSYYLPSIKYIYKTNMNDIYKCAILAIQKKSLGLIEAELIKKNASLSDSIWPKIDEKIFLIKLSLSKLWCIDSNEVSSIQKLNVLKQATYETCKYINYLEYLKKDNEVIESLTSNPKEEPNYSASELFEAQRSRNAALNEEIEHTYKIFPIAYQAYSEYENNIIIHFLLELLKEDYVTIKEKLHKTLNPLNQVVYKISNAMRKE